MRASAFGTTALSAFAPRLPPTTSSLSGPLRPAKRVAGSGCDSEGRAQRIADPLRLLQHVRERGEDAVGHAGQHLVGEPGHRVLLVQHQRLVEQHAHHAAREGDVAAQAEHHVGPHAAHHGRGSARRRAAGACGSRASVSGPLPRTPPNCTGSKAKPRGGTSFSSMLPGAPSQCTRQPRSRRASATARPGKMWPPVPPAMTSAVRLIPGLRA